MYEKIWNLWFFTATNLNWQHLLKREEYKLIISNSLTYLTEVRRCQVFGFVFMPNHIHLILQIPEETQSALHRDFLKFTSQRIILKMKDLSDPNYSMIDSTQNDRNRQVWERRPRWVPIETKDIFIQKLNYIHDNPVQPHWQMVSLPKEYYWSSCKSYLLGESQFSFLSLYEL